MESDSPFAHHPFDRLIDAARKLGVIRVAVAGPSTGVAMIGAVAAATVGLIEPILVGPESSLRRAADAAGIAWGRLPFVPAESDVEVAATTVALCRSGEALALMKGNLHTDVLMHAVLDRALGLRSARRVSHIFILDAHGALRRRSRRRAADDARARGSIGPGRGRGRAARRHRHVERPPSHREGSTEALSAYVLAATVGSFLHIGATDLLPELREGRGATGALGFTLGVASVAIAGVVTG